MIFQKFPEKALKWSSFSVNFRPTNYSLQPCMLLKFWKITEVMFVVKFRGRCIQILYIIAAMNSSLKGSKVYLKMTHGCFTGILQNFLKRSWTGASKNQNIILSRTPMDALE